MALLDDKTRIPLGLAIIVIGTGAIWATKYSGKTDALAATVEEIQKDRKERKEDFQKQWVALREDIATIKAQLELMNKRGGWKQ